VEARQEEEDKIEAEPHVIDSLKDMRTGRTYIQRADGKWVEQPKTKSGGATGKVTRVVSVPRLPKGSRKLLVSQRATADLALWRSAAPHWELNGLGLVTPNKDKTEFIVERIWMCSTPDSASGGSVRLDEDEQAKAIHEVLAIGRSTRDLCFYWHFHIGAAGWSGTDESAVRQELVWSDGAPVINLCMAEISSVKGRYDWIDPESGEIRGESMEVVLHGAAEFIRRANICRTTFGVQSSYTPQHNIHRHRSSGVDGSSGAGNDGGGDEQLEFEVRAWCLASKVCYICYDELLWDGQFWECPICRNKWVEQDGVLRPRQGGSEERAGQFPEGGSAGDAEAAGPDGEYQVLHG
jgi:hypothetical protein